MTVTVTVTVQEDLVPEYVLPIAFLASFTMISTETTAYIAYAICKEPQHCIGNETSHYAGFVAGATYISNNISIVAVGYFQKLVTEGKRGLMLWMFSRSMTVVMMLVGGGFPLYPFPTSASA